MKVLRSSLLVAAAAFAAACGDKVNIVQPTSAAAKINSVQVAPPTATISINQTVTLTAAVNADAGLTPTVAWSSSSSAAASVTQAGLVTGLVASPGVAICATASATNVASVVSCASVVVQALANPVPATVQIVSITGAGGLNAPVAVPPGTVAGQINVSVTVNPGTEKIDSLVVLVNGVSAGVQPFTSAQAAALRSAANAADQIGVAPIVIPINTAAYSTTTGTVTFLNGSASISAVAYGHQGAASAQNTASSSTNLLFLNADGFQVTLTNNGNKATDATGFLWWGNGTMTINALPVMYSGKTVGTVTGSLAAGTGTCVAGVGAAVSTTTPAAGVWSTILTLAGVQSPAGCTTTNPNAPSVTALDNNGNVITLGGTNGVLNTVTGVRWDNVAPAGVVTLNVAAAAAGAGPNGRALGWWNDAVAFNTLITTSATSNGLICNSTAGAQNCAAATTAPVDAGVGGTTFAVAVGLNSGTFASVAASTALTNTTTLAPSATNSTYCAVAYAIDALGNKTASDPGAIAGTTCLANIADRNVAIFGLDRAVPTMKFTGASVAANARLVAAAAGDNIQVTVADTGAVGNSGMLPAAPVLMDVSQRTAAATTLFAADGVTAATKLVGTGVTAAAPLYTSSYGAGLATAGYYTASVLAQDAAGNQTAVLTNTEVFDAAAATLTPPAVPATLAAASFSAASFLNDNLSIRDYYWTAGWAGAITAPATINLNNGTPTAVDAYNAATLTNTNFVVSSTLGTYAVLQGTTAGVPNAYSAANVLNAINLFVRDQAQAAYSTAAAAGYVVTAPAAGFTTGGATGTNIWAEASSQPANLCVATCAGATNKTSTTLTANATGATGTYNNPFSRVDFYMANGAGGAGTGDLILIGSVPASAATLVDNGATRVFTYTYATTGATLSGQLGGLGAGAAATNNLFAFGVNTAGTVALVSVAVAQTINP